MTSGVSSTTSRTIAISRVLCILCVIYVHVPPYGDTTPAHLFSHEAVIWIVREGLGRSSVPLLSIISGYLAARLANGDGFSRTLRKKVLTLLVPLLLWNAIAVLKDIVFSFGTALPAFDALPRLLLGVDGYPRLFPLYFLRDIFLCSLFAPLLLAGLRRLPWVLVAGLVVNAVWDIDGPLFLSSVIPLFYAIGLGVALRCWPTSLVLDRAGLSWTIAVGVLALLAFLPFLTTGYAPLLASDSADAAIQIVRRCAGAVAFWLTAAAIARHKALAAIVASFEPLIFFVFCCHPLVIGLAWLAIGPATLALGGGAVLAAFLVAPIIVLSISFVGIAVLRIAAPWLLRPLMAGRIPNDRQMAAALQPLAFLLHRTARAG